MVSNLTHYVSILSVSNLTHPVSILTLSYLTHIVSIMAMSIVNWSVSNLTILNFSDGMEVEDVIMRRMKQAQNN